MLPAAGISPCHRLINGSLAERKRQNVSFITCEIASTNGRRPYNG